MLPNSWTDFSQAFAIDLANISPTNDFRLCHPNNFNPSHQITQSEKMLIITTCRNRALYRLANLVQKSYFLRTYSKNYYAFIHTFFICHAPQPPMKQVVTSQFKIECFLIVLTLFGRIFHSCTNLTSEICWNIQVFHGVQCLSQWNNFVAAFWPECKVQGKLVVFLISLHVHLEKVAVVVVV